MRMMEAGAEITSKAHESENRSNLQESKERTLMIRQLLNLSGSNPYQPALPEPEGQIVDVVPQLLGSDGESYTLSTADFNEDIDA